MLSTLSQAEPKQINVTWKRPPLYPKQLEAIFCPERYGIIEASTKAGKTVGCLVWITEQAWMGKDGEEYWWVAPIYNQARIGFKRLKRALTRGTFEENEGRLSLKLLNGAVISFKSADNPDSLYGEDVKAAVVDEASRCKEEAWFALRSTLTKTRGRVRIIGNVKGRKNWSYALARKAESGEPDWRYSKLTAYDAVAGGVLKLAEIEDAKRTLPENVFRELYLAEPSDDGGNPFDLRAIRSCIGPLSSADPVVWGIDLAKSVDWTVMIALDASNRVCRFERFQLPWNETKTRILMHVNAPALVDSTGVGDPIVEDLQRQRPGVFEGFKFTSQSKQQIMEGLAVSIQQRDITFPEGIIVNELEEFEYVVHRTGVRYSAPDGMHDDTVCALALVNSKRLAPRPQPVRIHRF